MLKEPLESAPGSVLLLFRFSSEKPGWAGWPVVLKPCTWNPSNTSLPWLWCWMSWSASFLTDGEKQVMDWLKWNSKRMQDVVFFFLSDKVLHCKKDWQLPVCTHLNPYHKQFLPCQWWFLQNHAAVRFPETSSGRFATGSVYPCKRFQQELQT